MTLFEYIWLSSTIWNKNKKKNSMNIQVVILFLPKQTLLSVFVSLLEFLLSCVILMFWNIFNEWKPLPTILKLSNHSGIFSDKYEYPRSRISILQEIWTKLDKSIKKLLQNKEHWWINQLRCVFIFLLKLKWIDEFISLLAARVSQCKWNQPWHTPSQYPV